jgi:hypothetical protein
MQTIITLFSHRASDPLEKFLIMDTSLSSCSLIFPGLKFLGGHGGQNSLSTRWSALMPLSMHTGHLILFLHSFILCPSSPHQKHILLLSFSPGHLFAVCPIAKHLKHCSGLSFSNTTLTSDHPMLITPFSANLTAIATGHCI